MKKILLTNHFLREFSGSEIATLDIAKEFLAKGYLVSIGTFILSNPLKSEFDKFKMRIVDLNTASPEHFDLIWSHHFTTLDTCLIDIGITADKIIFSSLSPYESLESPPLSTEQVDLFLANSIETKDTLIDMGIDSAAIEIFPNPVSDDFFTPTANRDFTLQKIAIVSNHIPIEVKNTLPLLHNNGIEVKIFGIEGEFKLITPDILKEFDAVITIGRTVQYCLAMGIPVYCYDRFGGPGWITNSNIQNASEYNFSGRCTNRRLSSDEIVNEIIHSFSDIQLEKDFYQKFALEKYSLSRLVNIFLTNISTSVTNIYSHKRDLYKNILKRQRLYLNNKLKIDLFSQLFLDNGNGLSEENSIKLPVAQNTDIQEFIFDLSDRPILTNLRFDPLNDSCVIEIESLKLIKNDGAEIELCEQLTSNAIIHHCNSYFFDTIDSICYFSSVDFKNTQRLIARIRYTHIGRDALTACIDQTKTERNQTKGKLKLVYSIKRQKITEQLRKIQQILKGD